jgi:hypothetical protein
LEKFVQKQLNTKNREQRKEVLFPESLKIADTYHQVDWEKKLAELLKTAGSPVEKILMVTDFSTKIAGIEMYVHDASKAMRGMKYQVKII